MEGHGKRLRPVPARDNLIWLSLVVGIVKAKVYFVQTPLQMAMNSGTTLFYMAFSVLLVFVQYIFMPIENAIDATISYRTSSILLGFHSATESRVWTFSLEQIYCAHIWFEVWLAIVNGCAEASAPGWPGLRLKNHRGWNW